MKKDHCVFPAIFSYADDGISIEYPDLPSCLSCAENEEEALLNAKEVLELYLWSMIRDKEKIPKPTPVNQITLDKNQAIVVIDVWMSIVCNEMSNKSIKKTLTIPYWLNDIAEKNKVNFSQILQSALKEYLGIKDIII